MNCITIVYTIIQPSSCLWNISPHHSTCCMIVKLYCCILPNELSLIIILYFTRVSTVFIKIRMVNHRRIRFGLNYFKVKLIVFMLLRFTFCSIIHANPNILFLEGVEIFLIIYNLLFISVFFLVLFCIQWTLVIFFYSVIVLYYLLYLYGVLVWTDFEGYLRLILFTISI